MSKKKDSLKPWLSRPAVNRSVTLPLTRPLTQRLSNLNEFHPNELDPYLLFDAQSSMLGTLEASTLDLDPSDPSTLEVITATRAGTATYTDASGNIATAPSDTVRVDHVDGVPMILVEPSATNLVPDSNTFLKGSPVVRLGTTFEAPDGTNTAEGYGSIPATSGVEVSSQTASISPNTQYVSSVWVKGEAGKTASFYAKRSGGTFVQSNFVTVTLTGEWQRVTGMVMTTLSDNTGIIVKLSSSTLATQADEVYLWGAQVESGSVSTSVIPTSGSTVTRASDDLVISGSDFTDFYNQSEGTFYFEGVPQNLTDDTIYWMDMSPSNERIAIYDGPSYNVRFFVENIESVSAPYYPPNQLARLAISFKSNAQELSVNGGTSVTLTNNSLPSPTSLHIGSRYSLGNHLNGHIKRLIYWPTHSDSL